MTSRLRNLEHRFSHSQPTTQVDKELHDLLGNKFVDFVSYLNEILDEGRAKSIMLTELENASSWAHKALDDTITRLEENESKTPDPAAAFLAAKKSSAPKDKKFNYRKPNLNKSNNNKFNYRKPGSNNPNKKEK